VFHPGHQLSGVPLKIEAFAEFRGDDQLEQAPVAGALPLAQRLGDVDVIAYGGEASLFDRAFFGRAPARYVATMRGPLATHAVGRIRYAHGAALKMRFPRRRSTPAGICRLGCHPNQVDEVFEGSRPSLAFVTRHAGPARTETEFRLA
jgi:hypothetical protein